MSQEAKPKIQPFDAPAITHIYYYIYRLRCNKTDEIYIGSTCSPKYRLIQHKHSTNTCASSGIIQRNDYDFRIIDSLKINFGTEGKKRKPAVLRKLEQEWITKFTKKKCKVVNKKRAIINSYKPGSPGHKDFLCQAKKLMLKIGIPDEKEMCEIDVDTFNKKYKSFKIDAFREKHGFRKQRRKEGVPNLHGKIRAVRQILTKAYPCSFKSNYTRNSPATKIIYQPL
jgi:hypothetical protein